MDKLAQNHQKKNWGSNLADRRLTLKQFIQLHVFVTVPDQTDKLGTTEDKSNLLQDDQFLIHGQVFTSI